MTNPSNHFSPKAVVLIVFISAFLIQSCSTEREKYLFRKNMPIGKSINITTTANENGNVFRNNKWLSKIDWSSITNTKLTIKERLYDHTYLVGIYYIWKSQSKSELDSGNGSRDTTEELTYFIHLSDRDSILNLNNPDDSLTEDQVHFYMTIMSPVYVSFPVEPISPGHKWGRIIPSIMLNGDTSLTKVDYLFKGFTGKNGYDCALIEIKAQIAAALFPDPADSTLTQREEWRTVKGLLYFSLEHGWPVQIDLSSHVVSHRKKRDVMEFYIDDNGNRIDIPKNEQKIVDMFFKLEFDGNRSLVFSNIESN